MTNVSEGNKTVAMVEVVEYTDPICSWAWGTEPKLRLLQWRHGHRMHWRTVMGGLVSDAAQRREDWNAERAAAPMQAYWRRSSAYTGQPYPMPMRRMARSTDPAGRAVKAAELQGLDVAAKVLRRFRESTFIFGVTPETPEQFAASAADVPGLNRDRWLADLADPSSAAAYQRDWEETRSPNDYVRYLAGDQVGIGSMKHSDGHDRYAFPTLIMRSADGSGGSTDHTVAGWMPYAAYVEALEAAMPGSTSDPRPDPTPSEAFAEWGVLTANELTFLCGSDADRATLPENVVAHNWGEGLVYFTPEEAAARHLPMISVGAAQSFADLETVLEFAHALVATVGEDQWALSTPCDAWDIRAAVNHMVGGVKMVSYGLEGRGIGPEFYGNHLSDDPAASYREAIDEMLRIFRADFSVLERTFPLPWGDASGARLADMFMGDHLVHAWDVARALGRATDFDHALVTRANAFAQEYVPSRRGPEMFAAECEVPTDACPMDRLAAFVGRRV